MKRAFLSLAALALAAFVASPALAAPQAAATHKKTQSAKAAELVDLNTASEVQLAALPGVGDAYAKKIVEGRPYKSKDELVSRKVVPQSVYHKFQNKVVAKHSETK